MEKNIKKLEEGGIFGVFGDKDAPSAVFCGLYALQHRGQVSCGAALSDNFALSVVKGAGLVSQVIEPNLHKLKGSMGIGHVRYGNRDDADRHAQPLISNYLKGNISISVGGKITNADRLRADLEDKGAIFQTGSDAEIMAHLFAYARKDSDSIEQAVLRVMGDLQGAYAVLIMSSSKLLAFRDREGLRPLSMAKQGDSYYFASEDCAFAAVGAQKLRDIYPGELVMLKSGEMHSFLDYCTEKPAKTCIYEYMYFARADSEIDGVNVYDVRMQTGRRLYQTCPADADVVIGAPSAGLHYAMGYAWESGIPFGDGLTKNYYLGRTGSRDDIFRQNALSIKLNVIKAAVNGKRVVLVDDSMVRGITAKRIVGLLRSGGAKEVHLRIACPRFGQVCPYSAGIESGLKQMSIEEIRQSTGADSLMFLPEDELYNIGAHKDCCKKCFG